MGGLDMLMGALALRASIASYLSHTCGCSTRTYDSSTSIGTSDTIYQQGVGGWVKRKLEPTGSTAPTGKLPHASAGEEFLQRLNPNVTTVQGLAYASYPCTMVWHNMGA